MGVTKITGIILKEKEHGETSKHILVLAKGLGKVWLSARGARKPKSKLLAGTQLFCYCDFFVYEGRGFLSITQIDLIETFYELRTDMERFSHGAYLLELVERTCQEGMEQDEVLLLLLHTFWQMTKFGYNPKLASRIFELKFLQISGLMPDLNQCAVCGAPIGNHCSFSSLAGGVLCEKHKGEHPLLSNGAKKAMEYVFENEGMKLFQFRLSDAVLSELEKMTTESIQVHMNLQLKTKGFFDNLLKEDW